jgi:hypothetical protein
MAQAANPNVIVVPAKLYDDDDLLRRPRRSRDREAVFPVPTEISQQLVSELVSALKHRLVAIYIQHIPVEQRDSTSSTVYRYFVVFLNDNKAIDLLERWELSSKVLRELLFTSTTAEVELLTDVEYESETRLKGESFDPGDLLCIYRYPPFIKNPVKAAAGPQVDPPSNSSFLTQSHREAYETIIERGRFCFNEQARNATSRLLGGVKPRFNTMIAGPSACGKTRMARMVAEGLGCYLFATTGGNWIPRGSDAKPATAARLVVALSQYDRVLLFIDELDKIENPTDWTAWVYSCRADIYGLLDSMDDYALLIPLAKKDCPNLFPDDEDKALALRRALDTKLFIVGAGTWQSEYAKLDRQMRPAGFDAIDAHEPAMPLTMQDRMKGNKLIAEELRNRFHSGLIELRHPTAAEGRVFLEQNGFVDFARKLQMSSLLEDIDWANGGVRNIESIATELALAAMRAGMLPSPESTASGYHC